MVTQVLSWLSSGISFASDTILTFFDSTGLFPLFITMFLILISVKFVIIPLVGSSAGSDSVKRSTKRSGDSSNG